MSPRVTQEFAPEALAKAKELQVPSSLATRAALGVTLYLQGHREPRIIRMIQGGMKFLELCERDLSAISAEPERKLTNFPHFYKPSEIFEAPSMSLLEGVNLPQKLSELKRALSQIGTTQREPSRKKLTEYRRLLSALSTPYVAYAMNSMGEYKRSRKGSTW